MMEQDEGGRASDAHTLDSSSDAHNLELGDAHTLSTLLLLCRGGRLSVMQTRTRNFVSKKKITRGSAAVDAPSAPDDLLPPNTGAGGAGECADSGSAAPSELFFSFLSFGRLV